MATTLPIFQSKLVGRENEIVEIIHLLKKERLLTLTGPGGVGKTRLAASVGSHLKNKFPDGIFWIDLVPFSNEVLIPSALASMFGIHVQAGQSIEEALIKFFAVKETLAFFDNCEHVINIITPIISNLLLNCPKLKIVVTSRERLGLSGEHVWRVPPLTFPSEDLPANPRKEHLEKTQNFEAVQLFLNRAQSTNAHFELSAENILPVVKICNRLDGIPLAIELACARVNVLTVHQILSYLEDQISLLSASERDPKVPRHQSLEAAIRWSYLLLSSQEQTMLRRLSVFSGGFGLEAANYIYQENNHDDLVILDLLSSLANKSLVVADTHARKEARYNLLESIRIFCQTRLEEVGDSIQFRNRHLEFYLTRAKSIDQEIQSSFEAVGLQWLEENHNNLRKALEWSLECNRIEDGLKLATYCSHFWSVRGYSREGLAWFEQLFKKENEAVSLDTLMNAYVRASFFAMFLGEASLVNLYAQEITNLGEEAKEGEDPDIILTLGSLVFKAHSMGEYSTAFSLQDQVIQILREIDDQYALGWGLILQAGTAVAIGKNEVARKMLEEGQRQVKQTGDNFRIALALNYEGDLALSEKNYSKAKSMYERSIALYREINSSRNLADVANNLGLVFLHLEDFNSAFDLFSEALSIFQSESNLAGIAESIVGFGAFAVITGLDAVGLQLLEAGMALGGKRLSNWAVTNQEYQYFRSLVKTTLTEAQFKKESAVGRGLSSNEALANIKSLITDLEATPTSAGFGELTPREVDVVEIILNGMTNDEIASELVISKRTVEKHVSNILRKLNLSNRSQIVRWAIEHGWNSPDV